MTEKRTMFPVMTSETNIAARIIDDFFGGVRPMSRKSGWPINTIAGWKASGLIPAKRQTDVLELAQQLGIPLTHADFFPRDPAQPKTPEPGEAAPDTPAPNPGKAAA